MVWRNCRDAPWLSKFVYGQTVSIWYRLTRSKNVCHPLNMDYHLNGNCTVECISTQNSSRIISKDVDPASSDEELSEKNESVAEQPQPLHHINCLESGLNSGYQSSKEQALRIQADEMLFEQYRISATSLTRYETGHFRDDFWKGKMVEISVLRDTNRRFWDTDHPLASLLCKSWCKWLIAAVMAWSFITLAALLSLIANQNMVHGSRFRFTPLKLRGGEESNITGPGIQSIGFLQNGCSHNFSRLQTNLLSSDIHLIVSFSEPIAVNGWWFETQNESIELDPVVFILERSVQPSGDIWEVISSSSWTLTWSGAVFWGHQFHNTTVLRNSLQYFDMSVPWFWSAHHLTCNLLIILMEVLFIIVRRIKHHLKGRWIIVVIFGARALLNVSGSLLYVLHGQWEAGFVAGCFSIIDLSLPITLIFFERYLLTWVGFAGVAYSSSILVHYLVLIGLPAGIALESSLGFELIRNVGLVEGFCMIFLFIVSFVTKFGHKDRSSCHVRQDWAAYNACWEQLERKWHATFEKIHLYTKAAGYGLTGIVQQPDTYSNHVSVDTISSFGHKLPRCNSFQRHSGKKGIVHQFEQIFVRAVGLNIFLQHKIKQWALSSDGCFPICGLLESECISYMKWQHILEKGLEHRVQWAQIKSLERALEKVYRCYHMEPARLLDCCRQSIYFEDPEALFQCLRVVCSDPTVRLARVINRMHHGCDISATAGFRHVLLNLSLSTEESRRLRLDGVICELQLNLTDFAKMKVNLKRSMDDACAVRKCITLVHAGAAVDLEKNRCNVTQPATLFQLLFLPFFPYLF